VLCVELTRDVPPAAFAPDFALLKQELTRPNSLFGLLVVFQHEQPALGPGEFESRVSAALRRFTPEELRHWLKHGCPPATDAAQRVVDEIDQRPPNLLDALGAAAHDRERLVGALSLVPALTGALSLPARRLDASQLPLGGYADVTTRGEPERLLPSQFALDGLEFVRRFAEKELLYFRREEPHRPTREELVVLLDQGVRTWGGVRLALAGAVFALARLAERRGLAFRFAVSSDGKPLDPRLMPANELGRLLEASDLTAQPAAALGRLLDEPGELPRDVVLLTHPRSLEQDDTEAAARRARRRTGAVPVLVRPDRQAAAHCTRRRSGPPAGGLRRRRAALAGVSRLAP
jgi:hypothetical protein